MGSVPGSGAHTERLDSRPRHAFRTNGFRAPSILAGSTLAVLGVAGIMQRPHALAVPALGLAICGAVLVGLGVPRRRHPDHTGAGPGPTTEDGTAVSLLVHQQGGKTTLRYLEFRSPGVPPTSGTAAHQQEAEEVELRSPVRWRGSLYLVIGLATGAITAWDTLTAIDLADRVAAALRLVAAAGACWAGWLLLRATASRWSGVGGGMASLFIVSEYWRLAFADRWIDWRATVALFVASLVLLAVVVAVVVSWLCERWVNPVPGQRVLAVRIEVGLAVLALVGTLFAAVLQIGGGWYTSTHNPAQTHPNLTVAVDFGEVTDLSDLTVVPVEIGIRNGGQVALDLLMTQYTVVGFGLDADAAADHRPGPWEPLAGVEADDFAESTARYAGRTCPTVLQYGRVTETKTNLGPGEEKSTRVLVPLPAGKAGAAAHDGIRVLVHAAAAREDEFRLVDEGPHFWMPGDEEGRTSLRRADVSAMETGDVYAAWRIDRSTLRATLVSAPRELRVGWKVPTDGEAENGSCPANLPEPEPYVLFAYASDNAAAREANDELESRYDPFYVLAAAERLLAETGGSEETGSPSPPDSDAGDAASPAR